MEPTKLNVLFIIIIILASLSSTSSAGRRLRFVDGVAGVGCMTKKTENALDDPVVSVDHRMLLKVNTNDYRIYDPTPALSKPRFKLIPN